MKYSEYLNCAIKHASSCSYLFGLYRNNPSNTVQEDVFLDLYYLLGYVFEGVTIYSAYKIYNWPPNQDIQYYCNTSFTLQTNLDFYYNRMSKTTNLPVFAPGDVKYSVQGHCFQQIVKGLLQKEPVFSNFPYFGNGTIDQNVEDLINKWKPETRYSYKTHAQYKQDLSSLLTENNMYNLIRTCIDIIQKTPSI